MDEQRIEAYVKLIKALLSCPNGQESSVLQHQQELIDQGLLRAMDQVVVMLRQRSQERDAHRLEQIATQLAQTIGDESIKHFGQSVSNDLREILQELDQPSDFRDMTRRVELSRQALQLVSRQRNETLWAELQGKLGNNLSKKREGNWAANIEMAIEAYQQSLAVMTRETAPVLWAKLIGNLALAYSMRIRGDRAENIEMAIANYQRSLEVMTREAMPVLWAQLISNLALAYLNRIRGNRAENIEMAIANYQRSLEVIKQETMPVLWVQAMSNLGLAYSKSIQGNRAESIERAIMACEQSLDLATREAMPVEWAQSMSNLTFAYSTRIRGEQSENIEKAIVTGQQSLQVRTRKAMPVEWAESMSNLALAHSKRIKGNRAENIEIAITAYQQSLEMMTKETMPIEWATIMNNLANAYYLRIQSDRIENIEVAIETYRQALQVRTRKAMPIEWAETMNNLANAYSIRVQGDRAENIEVAIETYRQALQVRTRKAMPIEWAETMNNLANAYSDLIQGDRAQNIEAAIEAYQQSLEVVSREAMPARWAQLMNNLANAYFKRIRDDRAQNIEAAIEAYQQSLEVRRRDAMPVDWAESISNMAAAYYSRLYGDRLRNIETAVNAYSEALEIFTPEAHPSNCRGTARLLANLYANENQWDKAQSRYEMALNAVEILYQSALSKGSQEAELSETNDIYRRTAYAYAKVGNLTTAIATLEQGRARGLSETLQRDRADLEAIRKINPNLAERYQTAVNAINQLESTERRIDTIRESPAYSQEDLRQQAIQSRQSLKNCLTEIRQIPGHEKFLALPTFEDIAATVQRDHPLVYFLATPNGSLALVLTPEGVSSLWLNELTEPQLRDTLANNWFKAYRERQNNRQGWHEAVDDVTHQLWNVMMAPLISHLQQNNLSKAILIPTGYLSYLPLHAAWTTDPTQPNGRRYACDGIQFTYAPNALSLKAGRTIAAHTPATSLLAINEPESDTASPLPCAGPETQKAIFTFDKDNWEILQKDKATRPAVLQALPQHTVVHFSCHGSADLGTPLNSGLLMANDEILSLRDLLDLNLQNLRLAILSACETGIPGTKLPDEAVSLPTGLLQAGAAGVISSLWSVADLSTMLLLSRFYDLWRTEKLEAPEALRQAQIWLRDSDGSVFAAYLGDSNPRLVQKLETADNQRPFAHPFHWAAFTYVGV